MKKRRAKRIADRKLVNLSVEKEISEEEKPLLNLIARIIADIVIAEMDREEENKNNSIADQKRFQDRVITDTDLGA